MRRLLLCCLLLALLTACQRISMPFFPHAALARLPAHMLWAWEREEDLRWLPQDVGVAFLAATVTLDGTTVKIAPRGNPLRVRADSIIVPMVHVEAAWGLNPVLSAAQREALVAQVLRSAQGYAVVQLDFEVRRSQRAFLQAVVSEIRARLPRETALSITSLASWCSGDYWLAKMPADEIVPMAFRMGLDQRKIRQDLARDGKFPHAKCNHAIGYASDEIGSGSTAPRRYYYAPQAWTAASWQAAQEKLKPLRQ
jgi:hypothetical protein